MRLLSRMDSAETTGADRPQAPANSVTVTSNPVTDNPTRRRKFPRYTEQRMHERVVRLRSRKQEDGPPWRRYEGTHLLESLHDGSLGELLPTGAAVYRWRVVLRPPSRIGSDPATLQKWIERRASSVFGYVEPTEQAHFLHSERQWLCGAGLTLEQRITLRTLLCRSPHAGPNQQLLLHVLKLLEPGVPSLYVGETTNIIVRTKQHLLGHSSNLQSNLKVAGYTFKDLYLELLLLPDELVSGRDGDSMRLFLELLAARLSVSGLARDPKFRTPTEDRRR